jgi:glutathione S-transferase
MPELILHHYPTSPFAEKARLMLGYKALAWRSVTIPRWMPKPDLMPLTGGYRRTPVMQIGADLYCDTACIARELDRRAPGRPLFPAPLRGQAAIMGAWADSVLFFDVVGVVFGTHGASVPAELREDRRRFSEGAIDIDRYASDQDHLRARLRAHLFRLEHALDAGHAFLLGDAPCYADFCAWGPVWMLIRRVAELEPLRDMPQLQAWAARMEAIGHGEPRDLSSGEALEMARGAAPADLVVTHPVADPGLDVGRPITVAADDYGRDPVRGRVVALTAQRVVIRRSDPAVGEVNVHFPRAGFRLTPAQED